MATLLCRLCKQTVEAELIEDGKRRRCSNCDVPMFAGIESEYPKVVQLRERSRSTSRKRGDSRRKSWIGLGIAASTFAIAGVAAKLVLDASSRPDPTASIGRKILVSTPPQATRPLSRTIAPGAEATIDSTEASWIWLAKDEDSRESVYYARRDHDLTTLELLAGRGKAFRETPGAQVVIRSAAGPGYWVRIRRGNNPRSVGWISGDSLRELKAGAARPDDGQSPLRPGEIVELIGTTGPDVMLASDERAYDRLRSKTRLGLETEVFSVSAGSRAEVREVRPDRVRVRLEDLFRNGREGWIAAGEVRPMPTEEEMDSDLVDGLRQGDRRRVYLDIRAVDRDIASRAALGVVDEADVRGRARSEIARRFGIDAEQVKDIELEGDKKRWPAASHR